MRILFFVHRFWPSPGGVEKYIHQLSRALISLGNEVVVVAGATTEGLPETDTHEGVRIHRFPALRSPARCRWWLMRRRRLFAGADVIHVSNTHMLEYYHQTVGFTLPGNSVFLTRHGMSYRCPVPESEIRRARRSLRFAAGVVHDGLFIEKWLGVKPDLCPDQGLYPEADDLATGPEPPPTSAVYIGRLEPDSGIRIYVDAVRILTRELGRPFELHAYGGGSLLDALRDQTAREGLPVRFHGPTPHAQDRIVDSCFAFIDGRMAIQEAMARRRLVLAAYVDPLKRDYVCGERFSPYLIGAADATELAERVVHYTDNPRDRAELVERAFQHARTLSWHRTAEEYLRFWHERLPYAQSARRANRHRATMWDATTWDATMWDRLSSRSCRRQGTASRTGESAPRIL